MEIVPPSSAPAQAAGDEGLAPTPRQLRADEGVAWWGESWRIFCAAPAVWIGIAVVFAVLSIVLHYIPFIGAIASVTLLPVFAGGAMLGCHSLARGQPLTIGHLFEGFKGRRFAPLLTLGLLWLALLIVLAIVMVVTAFLALGAPGFSVLMHMNDPTELNYALLLAAGSTMIVAALVVIAIGFLAAMAYWFAPALVVLNGEPPVAALQKSFAASWRNIGASLVYGLIYIGLAIVATIPFALGWLVFGPMVAGSCYAGWRTIFGR